MGEKSTTSTLYLQSKGVVQLAGGMECRICRYGMGCSTSCGGGLGSCGWRGDDAVVGCCVVSISGLPACLCRHYTQ